MRNIIDKMNSLYPISDETIQILKENTVLCHFPKRHQLIEADKFCKSAYFIEEGMTRSFWLVNGEEITTSFGSSFSRFRKSSDKIRLFQSTVASLA